VTTPEVRITRFEVSCLPETHPEADLFTLDVEYRGYTVADALAKQEASDA
jgi:hypothetical protein